MHPVSFIQTRWPLLLLLLCLSCGVTYGQSYNQRTDFIKANSVWAFGEGGGLNFNSGAPVAFRTAQISDEGCASVADPVTGKLLFYSNGGVCHNVDDQIMPNGNGLLGNPGNGPSAIEYSTAQGVCIAPVINAPGQYYLFSLSGPTSGGPRPTGTLFYNIVDMSLERGLGNIVTGKKNIPLDRDSLSEAMITIPGENCDLWLVVHSLNQPLFKSYHITHKGIDTVPVLSTTGQDIPRYKIGSLCVSPDRSKIVMTDAINGTLLGRFDPATGRVSDAMKINDGLDYGVSFSPDNSKLYLSETRSLYQFDLTVFNSTAIFNSKRQVAALTQKPLYGLRLYRDTIYMVVDEGSYLHRINKPNLAAAMCDFQPSAIALTAGTISRYSLGNDVVFPGVPDTTFNQELDSLICAREFTLWAPKGFSTFEWEDGSVQEERIITQAGAYWLSNLDFCHSRVDTFILSGFNFDPPKITVNVHNLGTTLPYASYQWLLDGNPIAGATQRNLKVTQNGSYQVVVDNGEGCVATSEIYLVQNTAVSDGSALSSSSIKVYPVPTRDIVYLQSPKPIGIVLRRIDGKIVKSLQPTGELSLKGEIPGVYFVEVYDLKGDFLKREKVILLP